MAGFLDFTGVSSKEVHVGVRLPKTLLFVRPSMNE